MVMTKRHVEGIWSLNDAEAARFGPMMRDITGVIKDITGAERVHYAAMGEVALHYHNAILLRLPGQTPVWDSMDMVTRAHDDADAVAARDMERVLAGRRSEEHTSELQSLMRISYAVFCLKKKTKKNEYQYLLYETTHKSKYS